MRIIAGQFRSRKLLSPAGDATRPTGDRLRETLFNILGTRVAGAVFADLYAGTGAVGLEAISRGAREVHFAENGAAALASLRGNLRALGVTGGYSLEDRGTKALLRRLEKRAGGVDLVFLDPPYADADAYAHTLTRLGGSSLLATGALVVAEHATRAASPLLARYGSLAAIRTLRQGEASLTFFEAKAPAVSADTEG